MGIVEKTVRTPYIRSHPDFLEDLNHGDHVVCIEISEWHKSFDELRDVQKFTKDILMDMLEEIIILETDEDLRDLKKSAKKLHLRLNK